MTIANLHVQPFLKPKGRYAGAPSVIEGIVQRPWVQDAHAKPRGFWYSGGNDWWRWMRYEVPGWWKDYREVHEIEIDTSRVLLLHTTAAVVAFTRRYAAKRGWSRGTDLIDWRAVEQEWAGIEIIPYQGDLRLDSRTGWYYTWDAASGCIWDVTAITGMRHVGTMPPMPKGDEDDDA